MRKLTLLLLSVVASCTMQEPAYAETNAEVMIGVFCRTEAQISEVITTMRNERDAESAVAEVNKDNVVCVHPILIGYMIVNYTQVSVKETQSGKWYIYKGTQIGVMMGQVPRPVDPPVTQYFVSRRPLPNAIVLSGA